MIKLSQSQAESLKKQGYTHLASIVKSVYNTEYYNVHSIASIMSNGGKWIAADRGSYPAAKGGTWHGPIGINGNLVDWAKTIRMTALAPRGLAWWDKQ